MNQKQIEQAIEMHDAGINWSVIATYFKTTSEKLLNYRKQYGTANNN